MKEPDELEKLIDDISFRKAESKNYKDMKIEQISQELQNVMKFEQESLRKIEKFGKIKQDEELITYLKMICRNTIEREITQIQEIYLQKIDKEYLNSK
ncbi:MAG: hypothetical protein K5790_04240 [Nitrosopumilus sp.]|uniref:hypothetical protein n=1 Tax=Nitrosopumilus sp. TaxID=2024843 RepID=UPI00247BEEAC|nr:hypothetical protein [Nitrosopumilus sp.]MCV0392488.1 hypothetical protein [Nitrosopumilus sp.]